MKPTYEELELKLKELTQKHETLERKWINLHLTINTNTNREMVMRDRFFTVEQNTFVLDNNFDFDAGLKVSGDFVDDEKLRYAQMIASTLNNYNRIEQENIKLKEYLQQAKQYLTDLPAEVLSLIDELK